MDYVVDDPAHTPARPFGADFIKRLRIDRVVSIETIVDVVREPFLILDERVRVLAASEPFYQLFKMTPAATEGRAFRELGEGQWNIAALQELLADIVPQGTFFKGFEVNTYFRDVGHKVLVLNGRQLHRAAGSTHGVCPPAILLIIDDITEMANIAHMLASTSVSQNVL